MGADRRPVFPAAVTANAPLSLTPARKSADVEQETWKCAICGRRSDHMQYKCAICGAVHGREPAQSLRLKEKVTA